MLKINEILLALHASVPFLVFPVFPTLNVLDNLAKFISLNFCSSLLYFILQIYDKKTKLDT